MLTKRKKNEEGNGEQEHNHSMKEPEYIEGPEAREKFERGMIALFKVPKLPIGKGRVGPAWSVQIQITDRRGCL